MASQRFHEKFKEKIKIVSSYADIGFNPENAVKKINYSQIHESGSVLLKTAGNSVIGSASPLTYASKTSGLIGRSSFKSHSELLASRKSSTKRSQVVANKILLNDVKIDKNVNKSYSNVEYKPYTLKDYQSIRQERYFRLGGLGPSNVGSEDWNKKKRMIDKRMKYGKDVYFINAVKLPMFPSASPIRFKQRDSRTKAWEYAANILKPFNLQKRKDN
jgi:hypothetical protein